MHQSETGVEPLVSVALVVRNGENTVALAIRSILAQTYENWELLIADDGSEDQTVALIKAIQDGRIRFLPHPEARGLAFRLNQLIDVSRGKYFARMDADDFAFADRLAKQVRMRGDQL
jgi:glycosyltransferase involved in cell wall biosynthesis